MPTRKFTLEELENLEVEFAYELKEEVYEARWTRRSNVVFEYAGKYYLVAIEEGMTESQMLYGEEVFPDMWNGVVQCPEVELYNEVVIVKKWRGVTNGV